MNGSKDTREIELVAGSHEVLLELSRLLIDRFVYRPSPALKLEVESTRLHVSPVFRAKSAAVPSENFVHVDHFCYNTAQIFSQSRPIPCHGRTVACLRL